MSYQLVKQLKCQFDNCMTLIGYTCMSTRFICSSLFCFYSSSA